MTRSRKITWAASIAALAMLPLLMRFMGISAVSDETSTLEPWTMVPFTELPATEGPTTEAPEQSLDELRTVVLSHHGPDMNMTKMYTDSVRMLRIVNRHNEKDLEAEEAIQRTTCPPEPPALKKKNGCINCGKYKKYVANCNVTGTLFMDVRLPSFIKVMDTIARWADFKEGHHILDWGAGCGTKLNYWKLRYGVTGVGLDYTKTTVNYARLHGQDGVSFCWADGSKALKYLKENSFDRVVSHSALYHVMPLHSQCKVVYQAVRITKPGGTVWFGHFRSGPAIKFWKKGPSRVCPMPPAWNVTSFVFKDTRVFGGKESWYTSLGAVSIILKKGTPILNYTTPEAGHVPYNNTV